MARVNLTQGRVSDFCVESGKTQSFLWDSSQPGLGVRATAKSTAYVFQAKFNGRDVRITIGSTANWSILDARGEARRLFRLIDQGIDPRIEKKRQLEASVAASKEIEAGEIRVRDIWNIYVAERAPYWGKISIQTHRKIVQTPGLPRPKKGLRPGESQKTVAGALYALMDYRISDISSSVLEDWLERENKQRPTNAALAFRCFRAFANWAIDNNYKMDPSACSSKRVREKLHKVIPKTDCLQREMLKPWFEAVRKIENQTISTYLQILLLTGARKEEVLSMQWGEVDFRWNTLQIRDKVEGTRTIPLTPYVKQLLLALRLESNTKRVVQIGTKPQSAVQSKWVFRSNRSESGRLIAPSKRHSRALADAGLPPITIHGLRRSFGTLSEWVETPTGVAAQIMGHKPSATAERHYRVRPVDLLRIWHTKIENWILSEAGIEVKNSDAGPRPVEGTTVA